jgi:hypothetical protein
LIFEELSTAASIGVHAPVLGGDDRTVLKSPTGEPVPRVLTSALARRLGFTEKQIRVELAHHRWQLLVRGIYFTRPDRPERADWITAGLAMAAEEGVLSGWDAVRGYDIGSARSPVDEVLILTTGGSNRIAGKVRFRPSTRPLQPRRVGIWPTAPPARAVADTALVYRWFDPVRALVTSAVQHRLCTPDELEFELENGPQNGSAHLRRAVEDVFGGAESIAEAELADLITAAGLPPAELNVDILTWDGIKIASADALWRSLRAGLEVDSKKHHFYEDRWEHGVRRHTGLTTTGLSITHFIPKDLRNNPAACMRQVEEWLRRRAAEIGALYPPPPPPTGPDGRPIRIPYVLPPPLDPLTSS